MRGDVSTVSGDGPGVGNATDLDAAIYFLHGSGYAMCSPRTHRRLTRMAVPPHRTARVLSRLSPGTRHPFPAAADDAHAGWDRLTDICGLPPHRIVLAGDSAGGHLAVDLLPHSPNAPKPAGLVLLSPLADLTFAHHRPASDSDLTRDQGCRRRLARRVVLPRHRSRTSAAHPRRNRPRADASPHPIQAGGAEMLAGDTDAMAGWGGHVRNDQA